MSLSEPLTSADERTDPISSDLPHLPAGWKWATAEELCINNISSGGTPTGRMTASGVVPFLKVYNLTFTGDLDFTREPTFIDPETHATALKKSRLLPGDVLMNIVGPPLGKVSVVPNDYPEWNMNQAIVFFRTSQDYLNKLFCLWLRGGFAKKFFDRESKATAGQFNVRTSVCRQLPVPVPPLKEQRRIVARIEELTARSKSAKEALQAIPPLLEKFRQSVLAAAFRGDLTAEWRRQNPDVEPASCWLSRKVASCGRDAQVKLRNTTSEDPQDYDASGTVDNLPENWAYFRLEQLAPKSPISYGILKPDGGREVRLIKSGQVRDGWLDDKDSHWISERLDQEYVRTRLVGGEVLLNLVGASIGRSTVAPLSCRGANVSRAIAVIRTLEEVTEWVNLALQGPVIRKHMKKFTGGSAQGVLNLSVVRSIPIPIPPLEELRACMAIVSESLASHVGFKTLLDAGLSKSLQLDGSILSKAFRGELVPQEPTDEPASVLLDRITAQKTDQPKTRKQRA